METARIGLLVALLLVAAAAARAQTGVVVRPVALATCVDGAIVLGAADGTGEQWAARLRASAASRVRYVIDAAGTVVEVAPVVLPEPAGIEVALVNPPAGGVFAEAQIVALALLVDELRALAGEAGIDVRARWGDGVCARGAETIDAFDWARFRARLDQLAR